MVSWWLTSSQNVVPSTHPLPSTPISRTTLGISSVLGLFAVFTNDTFAHLIRYAKYGRISFSLTENCANSWKEVSSGSAHSGHIAFSSTLMSDTCLFSLQWPIRIPTSVLPTVCNEPVCSCRTETIRSLSAAYPISPSRVHIVFHPPIYS